MLDCLLGKAATHIRPIQRCTVIFSFQYASLVLVTTRRERVRVLFSSSNTNMSSTKEAHDPPTPLDTFSQINSTLLSNGLVERSIDLSQLPEQSVRALSDAIHGLLSQKHRDAELKQSLSGRNRTLESSLERTKRFWKEDEDKRVELEHKVESFKAQLRYVL